MPDRSEFTEKEFEGFLYNELAVRPGLWTPDQVMEQYLGFDAAIVCAPYYWHFVGRSRPVGVVLPHIGLGAHTNIKRDTLPDFRFNLFVQAKRTWQYRRLPSKYRAKNISPPHRYLELVPEQRDTLAALATHFGDLAAVTFAGANLMKKRQLYELAKARGVLQNSTFPPIEKLVNHHRWLFNKPGASGFGLSEPEEIEAPDLLTRLRNARRDVQAPDLDIEGQLLILQSRLHAAFDDGPYSWLLELVPTDDNGGAFSIVRRISFILNAIGVRWLVVGPLEQ